jgi:hypothetical protein
LETSRRDGEQNARRHGRGVAALPHRRARPPDRTVRFRLRRDDPRAGAGETALVGEVWDQSQLYGVLDRLRDFGLELVSVEQEAQA